MVCSRPSSLLVQQYRRQLGISENERTLNFHPEGTIPESSYTTMHRAEAENHAPHRAAPPPLPWRSSKRGPHYTGGYRDAETDGSGSSQVSNCSTGATLEGPFDQPAYSHVRDHSTPSIPSKRDEASYGASSNLTLLSYEFEKMAISEHPGEESFRRHESSAPHNANRESKSRPVLSVDTSGRQHYPSRHPQYPPSQYDLNGRPTVYWKLRPIERLSPGPFSPRVNWHKSSKRPRNNDHN
jgi:hypothetical protein